MDENISYDDAVGAIEASVHLFDTAELSIALRGFPVLQVFASQRLIRELTERHNSTDVNKLVKPITEWICIIVLPCDLLTAECRICATSLFYAIRDRDDHLLSLILKRMLVAQRSCDGCGLFILTALTESLKQNGNLLRFIANHVQKDEAQRNDTETQFWRQVLDLLEREHPLKADDGSPVSNLESLSLHYDKTHKNLQRLRLRTNGRIKRRRRQRLKARLPSDVNLRFDGNQKERVMLLKLVTMYVVCPDFVAEKLNAHGLKSYCAAKLDAIRDLLLSSPWKILTSGEVLGMRNIASTILDPSLVQTTSAWSTVQYNLPPPHANEHHTFDLWKPWMPLDVGIRNVVRAVLGGQICLDIILDRWRAIDGSMRSAIDQIIITALADDEVFRKLTTWSIFAWRASSSSDQRNSDLKASLFRLVADSLRCIEQALRRALGYPSTYWDHAVQVFHRFASTVVWLFLHDMYGACEQEVKEVILLIRSLEKSLQDNIEYQRTEPRKDTAVLEICDCLSLNMRWKRVRRLRSKIWRKCNCMIPNTVFIRVPHPSTWFSWIRSMLDAKKTSGDTTQEEVLLASGSLWLYENSVSSGEQYNYSELDVLRSIIDNVLLDETGGVKLASNDVLAYVLKKSQVRQQVLSEIAVSIKKNTSKLEKMSDQIAHKARLQLLRKSIERLWISVCHESKLPMLRLESEMLSKVTSADFRLIEDLLAIVAPCSSSLHDCIREMPKFCEHVALMHRHSIGNEKKLGYPSMHIKLIGGLMSPSIDRKRSLKTKELVRRDPIFDTVMLCFD